MSIRSTTPRPMMVTWLAAAATSSVLAACGGNATDATASAGAVAVLAEHTDTTEAVIAGPAPESVGAVVVASGLAQPWSLAFLPDGRALVTERAGTLRIVDFGRTGGAVGTAGTDSEVTTASGWLASMMGRQRTGSADNADNIQATVSEPIEGLPAVAHYGQGGLLDVVVSPEFEEDRTLWFTFAEQVDMTRARTAVARARLDENDTLTDVEVVFRQVPALEGGNHYGSRLAIAPDGTLFVTLGDRYQPGMAQDPANHVGKVVRIDADGSIPSDNPFVGVDGVLPEIWSYGHRNPQGAAIDPITGTLWTSEHGPWRGDEINLPQPAGNHGWPLVTYGEAEGSETLAGEDDERAGLVAARFHWSEPRIAPSGIAFQQEGTVAEWDGDLFAATLAGRALIRLVLDDERRVVGEQRLLTDLGERLRDVASGPDGHLYVLTDGADAALLRVVVTR
jgi:aldose sugar dehydrogenase